MQVDAFPDKRSPLEWSLVKAGKFEMLVQAFTADAETMPSQFNLEPSERERRAAESLKRAAMYQGEIAARQMDLDLPF
jgi:hypothetical protein